MKMTDASGFEVDPLLVPARPPTAMRIRMSTGLGEGPTTLAAFDAALLDAGVANYNLVCLSSVIPPSAEIVQEKPCASAADYGRRLYVVMSQMREHRPGRAVHAGIGWIQDETSGRGLFVELHDADRNRLERDLHASLEAMRLGRAIGYGSVQTRIAGRCCIDRPVCALVVAVYTCEAW